MHQSPRLSAYIPGSLRSPAAANILQSIRIPERLVGVRERTTPAFSITRERGFLPREDPLVKLPSAFAAVESLLERMTIRQSSGGGASPGPGLLATGQFGDAVAAELGPLRLDKEVKKVIESGDQMTISALFRDYSFLTSAYLLEPVDRAFRATGKYTTGRSSLPSSLARPMTMLADKLGQFPFMEYASSYALQNWARNDPSKPIEYSNLRLIRAFEDHQGSEKGFILVHVDMVAHSGALVAAAEDALSAALTKNRGAFDDALTRLYETYKKINTSMETMWSRSKPSDYLKFRSFIFGTAPKAGNPMFPNGVIYEGVAGAGDEKTKGEPTFFRGESGANDSMIPLGDNLLEITAKLPDNDLTKVLRDFRQYRPPTQRAYIASVEARATLAHVKEYAFGNAKSLALYILNVDQIREFRERHWRFTKEYIIRRSSYSVATGGSPILKYLPQNLRTVVSVLDEACAALGGGGENTLLREGGLTQEMVERVEECKERSAVQKRVLEREMEVWEIIEEQRQTELVAQDGAGRGVDVDMGEEKRLQRGSVGSDRGG